MKSVIQSLVTAAFMFAATLHAMAVIAGAEVNCSFNSQLDAETYSYNIAVTSEDSCSSQLLRISIHKEGNPFAQLLTPYEAIVEKTWIADLDNDGKYELIVISRDPADDSKRSFDLYALDGSNLKQVRLPEPPEMTGYRGGDRFLREGMRIVRVFPVYFPQDDSGSPTGGERRVVYRYKNREILLESASEVFKPAESVKKGPNAAAGNSMKSSLRKINAIKPRSDYIEILADGPIEKYKVTRVDGPWRLIVDIAEAGTGMKEKTVVVNRHGITTARIGEHKGFVRIVFDTTLSPLPTEIVTPAENALRVGFYSKAAQ